MQWSQLELELFRPEVAEPTVLPVGQVEPCPEPGAPDPIATQIRQRLAYADPRESQGVVHRAAMAPCELTIQTAELRRRCETGAAPAVLTLVALVAGISPSLAPDLPLRRGTRSAVVLDPERGWVSLDFARIFLGGAATAPVNETALPATHVLLKPLPVFLADIVRQAFRRQPQACRLRDLFGDAVPGPQEPLDGCQGGRLRATAARMRRALPAFALRLGLDRYDAALVTGEMSLVPRSRFFYVRSDIERYMAGCRRYFDALGWGDPVTLDVALPFGSQVVPATVSVQMVHRHLLARVEAVRPARRYSLDALIEHHNRFVIAAGWFLSFNFGSRELRRLDITADRCLPGISVMECADKLTGAFRRLQPVLLCHEAQTQVASVWDHLVHLSARADKLGVAPSTPWRQHLGGVLAHRPVPVLFLIRRDAALPIGTRHTQLGVGRSVRLAPNAGRHFWQTVLLNRGVPSEALNVWARHASAGIEPMTSTSVASIDSVRTRVCAEQDAVLRDLGISAFVGIGPRSSR
jgi:hypothetical protein